MASADIGDTQVEYLRTDERVDLINSLEHCLLSLRLAKQNPLDWKWVLLSLHGAVQGAIVFALGPGSDIYTLTDRSIKETLEWHDRDGRGEIQWIEFHDEDGLPGRRLADAKDAPPERRLADLNTLYKRVQKPKYMRGAMVHTASPAEQDAVRRLSELRHEFVHFLPKTWAIELAGLPDITQLCVKFIRSLVLDMPDRLYQLEDGQVETLRRLLEKIDCEIAGLSRP